MTLKTHSGAYKTGIIVFSCKKYYSNLLNDDYPLKSSLDLYTIHYTYIYNSRTRMVTNSISAASAFFGTTSVLNEDRMFEGKTPTAF
jgi:hypothetical protein